ncbi:conserved Plasmodium protein, unknown function [Plasmodium gallinaceum]|uniref:Uncharacterized protein n=1 Tax=Plasmodium gallinaceum TaxID=5849 RepID=A0A1J1GMK9_PLAGA|nr:conserved Plasmodium protein, unknown function [Plasmodium gallinaceum]CRG93571.1 conserved Plasmodium protein, unknown function [Plasmodium gallinaceum]
MKFHKRKKTLKKNRNNNINHTKNNNDSEIESDDILSSAESNDNNLALLHKKKKINDNISDDDVNDNNNSNDDENDDIFNNPEERKIYLAKKYLKDLGVQSSDRDNSSESSVNSDDEQKLSKLSNDLSSDENEEKKKIISKMLMEKEKSKSVKSILNLGNKVKIFYDEVLSTKSLNINKKDTKNVDTLNNKIDENVIFFRGHKKSVTCVACPDYNLSFLDQYDYTYSNNKYKGYNNGKFYEHDNNNTENYSFSWHDNINYNDNNVDHKEIIIEPKIFENTSISTIYTGGKDACIIEWDLIKGEKVHIYKGCSSSYTKFGNKGINHFKSVMDIYCHKFNSFFISVGSDNLINVWDNRIKKECINSNVGHKNIISGIIGCNDTTEELHIDHNFFTSSYDKTIKLWDLRFFDKCINTYLGHTNNILSMNSISQNKLVTSSSDYTLRIWNTKNDNHILYSINYEIIESCCTLNNKIFIAGTFSGHIYIFTSSYKKPICIQKNAHSAYSITALISIPFTNIFISGSYDGYVHFWEYKNINKIAGNVNKILTVQIYGTINKFSFSHNYKYLFIAVGNEMKHGTWTRTKNKSGLAIIPLHFLS